MFCGNAAIICMGDTEEDIGKLRIAMDKLSKFPVPGYGNEGVILIRRGLLIYSIIYVCILSKKH